MKLLDITPNLVKSFLAAMQREKEQLSGYTVHQYFRVLRTFFKWCVSEGFLPANVMENIKPPRLPQKVIATFSVEEIQAMLSFCPPKTFLGARNRAMILALMDTGMRASELIGLKIDDVDFKTGIVRVTGKGNKERFARMGNTARKELWRYMLLRDIKASPNTAKVWLSEEMRPLASNGLGQTIRKLGRKAHIRGTRCSPHTFRHTFAVTFLRNGGDIFNLQTLLGHSSLEMVKVYSRTLNDDDAIRAHEKFSPGDAMGLK